MLIALFSNGPLTSTVLMRLLAICARNLCSAKTVQSVLFDGQSALLRCPKIQVPGDIFSIECRASECADAVGRSSPERFFILERSIEQIGPENVLRGSEQVFG